MGSFSYLNDVHMTLLKSLRSAAQNLQDNFADLSNFNTQNVAEMAYMFYYCYSLTMLNVSNFNTQKNV